MILTERIPERLARLLKSFERMQILGERMSQPIRTGGDFNRTDTRGAGTAAQVVQTDAQAVRTDTQVVRTAEKWLANGILFENGNSLVYVFP